MTAEIFDRKDCFALWRAQVLRFTAFHSSQDDISPSDWWAELVGESPDAETTKPKQAIITAEGSYKDGRLTLTKSPAVIDLRFQLPTGIQPSEVGGIRTIGAFQNLYPDFIDMGKRLFDIDSFPAVSRCAFGAELALPVKNQAEGYVYLASYLPAVQIDANNSRDFVYQINRRRQSRLDIPELTINRLNSWGVMRAQRGTINVLDPNQQPSAIETFWACKLDLDINTWQEFKGDLPRENYSEILDELLGMGIEIVNEGDLT